MLNPEEILTEVCDPGDPTLIRKMGMHEQFFHEQIKFNGIINATAFFLSTSIDLFAHKDVISRSVNYWKRTQPFLSSRVVSLQEPVAAHYFAYMSDEKLNKADNITYLYFKNECNSPNVNDCKDYWKLLIEREFTIPINWVDGPMWRLMLVELKANKTERKFEYCLISTATHSIFDGHSAFQSLTKLLYIIENVYANKLNKEHIKPVQVASTIEDIVVDHLKRQANFS